MKNNELLRIIVTNEGVIVEGNSNNDAAKIFSALVKINLAVVTQYCKPEGKINVFNAVSDLVKSELKDNDYLKGIRTIYSSSEEESEQIREDFVKGGVSGNEKPN